jgi:hypothetical protein
MPMLKPDEKSYLLWGGAGFVIIFILFCGAIWLLDVIGSTLPPH